MASARNGEVGRPPLAVRSLPAVYLAIAMVALLLLLPSALRPVRPAQSTTTELSPNAPPDPKQNQIISALNSGQSSTAGVGGQGPGQGQGVGQGNATGPCATNCGPHGEAPSTPRACAHGYGVPLRQVESFYSPPCAKAFTGDNGGATSTGVTRDQVNIGFLMQLVGTTTDGPIAQDWTTPGLTQMQKTYSVWQKYFNDRMQFYGRHLQFYYVTYPNGGTDGAARADKAVDLPVFAALQETDVDALNELTRRKVTTFTLAQVSQSTYVRHQPYLWSFTPDGTRLVRMGAEYVCKRLANYPPFPRAAGDQIDASALTPATKRKFGILALSGTDYDNVPYMKSQLKQECGIDPNDVVDREYTANPVPTGDQLATNIAALKSSGVTTVIYLGDLLTGSAWTQTANAQGYHPEWFLPGFGGVDFASAARSFEATEWKHAFGFTLYEIPPTKNDSECYRAYHEIDSTTDPDDMACQQMWGHLVQLMGGIQQAGPRLTPQSFAAGMFSFPKLSPIPYWKVTGSYGPGDFTYPDYASEIYWDPLGTNPYDGQQQTYAFPNGGHRYTDGEWPAGQPNLSGGVYGKPPG